MTDEIQPEGAAGDAVTDDTASLQGAVDAAMAPPEAPPAGDDAPTPVDFDQPLPGEHEAEAVALVKAHREIALARRVVHLEEVVDAANHRADLLAEDCADLREQLGTVKPTESLAARADDLLAAVERAREAGGSWGDHLATAAARLRDAFKILATHEAGPKSKA